MDPIKDKLRYHALYDIYQGLLTDKQKQYFEYYYFEDYSLSEIAEMLDVSRNAVHDQVKKVLEHLDHYESTLKILDKHEKRSKLIQQLENYFIGEEPSKIIKKIEKLEE